MRLLIFLLGSLLGGSLSAQCVLTGIVSNERGHPLVGANVWVVGALRGAATDADGTYRITNLPIGEHALEVSYLGYATTQQPIEITATATETVCRTNIRLTPVQLTTEALTVTATRANARTPVAYTNLDSATIQAGNYGQDMPYVLRWTPSVVVSSDAGTGIGYTGIWVRGSDPTRINVTINGIPYNDAESQGTFWVNLPDFASSAQDIQLQRGVGTSTNGAGAFGATLNISTADLNEQAHASLDGGVGAFGTRRGTLRFGTGLLQERWSVEGRLSRIHSDGYIDRARADLNGWYLSGAYVGERTVVRLNAFGGHEVTYQAWNGVPADSLDSPTGRTFNSAGTQRPGSPHPNEVDNYQQTHFQLLLDRQLSRRWKANLAGHYTRGRGYFELYRADEAFTDYGLEEPIINGATVTATDLIQRRWLDNDFYGAVYSLAYRSNGNQLEATLGGGYHRYDGDHFGELIWMRVAGTSETEDRYYENDARKTDFNLYNKYNYQLAPGLSAWMDLQWRRVDYAFLGLDDDLNRVNQAVTHHFFNPKVGVFWRTSDRANTYLSYGVAQREPNRNDYVDNPAATQPVPEQLYNTEAGWQWTGSRSNLGINLYHMDYRNQLVLNGQLNDVGEYIRTNVARSYRAGVELQAGTQLGAHLTAGANATLSRNRIRAFTEYIDQYDADFNWLGQRAVEREEVDLAFSPNLLLGGQLGYRFWPRSQRHDLQITGLGQYVGERFLDNAADPSSIIPAYLHVDLRVSYSWQPTRTLRRFRLSAQVNNLLDRAYASNGWSYRYDYADTTYVDRGFYPQAGRFVLVTAGIDL